MSRWLWAWSSSAVGMPPSGRSGARANEGTGPFGLPRDVRLPSLRRCNYQELDLLG